MIERATPFLRELMEMPASNVAIVSHGVIGRVMIGILMQFTAPQFLSFSQPNDVIYRVSLPARSTGDRNREIHRYVAAAAPAEGVVERR